MGTALFPWNTGTNPRLPARERPPCGVRPIQRGLWLIAKSRQTPEGHDIMTVAQRIAIRRSIQNRQETIAAEPPPRPAPGPPRARRFFAGRARAQKAG